MEHYRIRLLQSGQDLSWMEGSGTLLELLESAGLRPGYGCRMGTCGTCALRLAKGTFQYDPEPFIEAAEGNVLICCAIPTADLEIDL